MSARGSPPRSRPPTARATLSQVRRRPSPNPDPAAPLVERLARDRHIVKRKRLARDLLVLLVPFAGHDDQIAGLGQTHPVKNRVAAVGHRHDVGTLLPRFGLRAAM